MDLSQSVLRLQIRRAGVLSILLMAWVWASVAPAQTEGDKARGDTEQAIETRQQTQQLQDSWSEEKDDLARRFRAATENVRWLSSRKIEETAEADALDDRVVELERRLGEADRLEGSMQDTLMVIFHRLEDSVAAGLPFLPQERRLRLASVGDELVRPDVTSAEKLRRLLEALQVEAGYASSVEVYQDEITVGGDKIHADVLRLGRAALFWRTADGDRVGHFDPAAGLWSELPGGDKRRISLAMEMAERMRTVELIDLPLGRIEP